MVSLQNEFDIEVDWRGFFLHPEIPKGGESIDSLFPKEQAKGFMDYLKRFASDFGVPIEAPTHIPNTHRALAITEYARDLGKLEAFRDATMEAYWLECKDIEDDAVLYKLAESSGLDPALALTAADDSKYHERIAADLKEAKAKKVTGIPTIFIGKKMIVGCHPFEDLKKAAEKAGLRVRQEH